MTVVAPAGYGKTTAASQWCHSDDRPAVWVEMTNADNDPVRLLLRLAGALERVEVIDPDLVADLAGGAAFETSLTRLIDTMKQRSPVLIVLDDVHVLHRKAAHEVLGALSNVVPPGGQLLLVCRTEPPIPLARLRIAGDLHEVRALDLALDAVETAEVLDLAGMAADTNEAAEVCAQTEGWPAAVALVAMAHHTGRRVALTGRDRRLADYFTEEVLSQESAEERRFLLETSITRRISAPLCDAVTGRHDSARRLSKLVMTNLFVVPLDEDRIWYRYHHLFQDLLQAELERTGQDTVPLLDRAAAWHEVHGDPAEAFEYACRAGNFRRAGRVLLGSWEQYANRGQLETLLLLLDQCRVEDIESDTQLAVGAGWVAAQLGDRERADRYLVAASRGDLDGPSADGHSSVGAAMRLLRATIGVDGASRMLEDGLALVASELPDRTPRLVGAYRSVGVAEQLLGHPDEAIVALDNALVLTRANPVLSYVGVWCLGHLALAHIDLGHWNRAESCSRDGEVAMAHLEGRVYTVPVLAARATIQAMAADRPSVTATVAKAVVALDTTAAAPGIRGHLAWRLAEAAHMVGENDLALDLMVEARTACAQAGDAGMIPDCLDRLELNMLRLDPRLATLTPAEKRVLAQLATHRTQQEIAKHLYISRATVKTHVASIYSKLGVTSRDEAVALLPEDATQPLGRDARKRPSIPKP